MDWIPSLFNIICPFCGLSQGHCRAACADCASQLARRELEEGVQEKLGELELFSLGLYEGWLQSVVLKNKQMPPKPVVEALARLLVLKMPSRWRTFPIVWVPGRPLGAIHLVESLALALERQGHALYPRSPLRRRMGWSRPQKALSEEARRARLASRHYSVIGSRRNTGPRNEHYDNRVLLLDDVVTTGSTVTGCSRLLKERLGLEVQGALSVAFTPPSY